MFIQFGHNDEKIGTNNYSSPEDYGRNLAQFIDEVRAKRARPVLFTPVVRRKFDGTHFNPVGARTMAQLAINALRSMKIDLATRLRSCPARP